MKTIFRANLFLNAVLVFAIGALLVSCGTASDEDVCVACDADNGSRGTPTPAPGETPKPGATAKPTATPNNSGRHVWTVAEIESETPHGGAGGDARCGGEFGFARCICAGDVPSTVRYRPAVAECNGNAAAILSGRLLDAFSIVVRDTQNRDRWPLPGSGFGGCSAALAGGDNPPNRCSAFKAQDIFAISGGAAKVYCFGASGYSTIFADAARLTVKLSDNPVSNDDEIERYCLAGPTKPLN